MLLSEGDPGAEDCLPGLSQLQAAGQGELYARLQDQIHEFEFEEAATTLREAAAALKIEL